MFQIYRFYYFNHLVGNNRIHKLNLPAVQIKKKTKIILSKNNFQYLYRINIQFVLESEK